MGRVVQRSSDSVPHRVHHSAAIFDLILKPLVAVFTAEMREVRWPAMVDLLSTHTEVATSFKRPYDFLISGQLRRAIEKTSRLGVRKIQFGGETVKITPETTWGDLLEQCPLEDGKENIKRVLTRRNRSGCLWRMFMQLLRRKGGSSGRKKGKKEASRQGRQEASRELSAHPIRPPTSYAKLIREDKAIAQAVDISYPHTTYGVDNVVAATKKRVPKKKVTFRDTVREIVL